MYECFKKSDILKFSEKLDTLDIPHIALRKAYPILYILTKEPNP